MNMFKKKNTCSDEFIKVADQLNELLKENKKLKEKFETFKQKLNNAITDDREAINKINKKIKELLESG